MGIKQKDIKNKFSKLIFYNKKDSYIQTVLEFMEKLNIEFEEIKNYINEDLKDKIKVEAVERHLLKVKNKYKRSF